MHYGLTGLTYSPDRFLEVTQSEFEEITTAKAKVVTFVAIEEKFDLVIENYADYERDLLEVSLQRLLSPGNLGDYDRTRGHSHAVARRLVNLLSAARLYLDQVAHDLITVYGPDSPAAARMKEARKKEYDDRLAYRVMEKLRNHVQHRGMPIWGISYPSSWDEPPRRLRFSVAPILDLPALREDPEFNRDIVRELEGKGEQILLTPLVREYIEGLGVVHEALRAATTGDSSRWEQVLVDAQKRAYAHFGEEGGAVGLVALADDGKPAKLQHIFRQMWEYRGRLTKKNSLLSRLAARYISTAHDEGDA